MQKTLRFYKSLFTPSFFVIPEALRFVFCFLVEVPYTILLMMERQQLCSSAFSLQDCACSWSLEGHHDKWWIASREAHFKRAELTSGLSVGLSLCLFVCLFVRMFVCKRVSRWGDMSSQ